MNNVVGVKIENLTEQQKVLADDFISQHIEGNA